ncbi:site-specific recombinase, phage integrase family [Hydrocarboniphaga effusa AP103]|uniref:Site-specific recombinase, phage integrase family n=2 Tax=Nevskiaceae TaxID=568386 RepID=I8T8V8_9GAMM|nr:site-specific recombinase, phage integrase family [Hydrocarboniphaga effusa AP103]EIT70198.1 site-specific recombinase, phage integrase family [Hydrocarboniphaga effusa AP103]
MYLLVTSTMDATKGKRWRLKYRFGGTEKLLALGSYPQVSLKEARARRDEARALLSNGVDPGEHRKTEKRESALRRENTFRAVSQAWYALKSAEWSVSTASKVRTYLDLDLIPQLGDRPIPDIKRPELVTALRKIEKRDALDVAKKARGWLGAIFAYAHAEGVIEDNPALALSAVALKKRARSQHAHLQLDELPAFLKAMDGYAAASPDAVDAISMLLLTAVRPGELRGASWDEIDLDAGVWSIPAERMKMRRPHIVPLPTQAITLLRERFDANGDRPLVFASPYKPKQVISENTINVAIGRMGYKGKQTGHGFRHIVSTALNERGYNSDWIEKQLAHGSDDEIRDTYNKAAYLEQRRKMMQAWADHLDRLRDGGGNVIELRAA